MASPPTFDPYHRWLGIAPKDQPPHHYRLLGVDLFESDLDVLEMAADQRMSHLRTFQNGPTSSLSQRLLNEVSAARVCLLNPERKAAYDAQMRAKLEQTSRAAAHGLTSLDQKSPRSASVVPVAVPLASPTPRSESAPLDVLDSIVNSGTAPGNFRSGGKSADQKLTNRAKPSGMKGLKVYGLVAVVVGMAGLAGVLWSQADQGQHPLVEADSATSKSTPKPIGEAEKVPLTKSSEKNPLSETEGTALHGQASDDKRPPPASLTPNKQPGTDAFAGSGPETKPHSAHATTAPPAREAAAGIANNLEFDGQRIVYVGEMRGHADQINCIALSRDGQVALSGGNEGSVHLWNISKLEHARSLASHAQAVDCVAISPAGNLGLSGGGKGKKGDCELRVWDLATGREKKRLSGHQHSVRGALVLPGESEAISVSYDSTIRLWNLATATDVRHFEAPDASGSAKTQVWGLAITRDSRRILTGTRNNSAHFYEIESGRELQTFVGNGYSCFGPSAISSDDQRALVASNGFSGMESALYHWDLASGRRLRHTPWNLGKIASIVFLPNSKYALIACRLNEIVVWDADNGVQVQSIPGHVGPVICIAISADGGTFISGSLDRTVRVWSVK